MHATREAGEFAESDSVMARATEPQPLRPILVTLGLVALLLLSWIAVAAA